MENTNKYGIILDGKMDEPIWDAVEEYTGFNAFVTYGGQPQEQKTYFKILPCEDRIYFGVKCMEPGSMAWVEESKTLWNSWGTHDIEIFLSPSGEPYEFYQFVITYAGAMKAFYYTENGNVKPEPYAPVWNRAVYSGEDYWSIEVEIPLTAFYWTPNEKWSDKWLMNMARTRTDERGGAIYSTWAATMSSFIEPELYNTVGGFPIRPKADEVRMVSALATIKSKNENGISGTMVVKAFSAEAADYEFSSDHGDTVKVTLQAGDNEFTVPCYFDKEDKLEISMELKRLSDGKVFKRYYPVRAVYEPVVVKLTKPQYRNNFYPGQDYSQIIGVVTAEKPVTVTLEGAGIPKQSVVTGADGSFRFETPNFQEGEAWLTATMGDFEVKKKIRRLAPIENTMVWIEDGNLIVNGKPTLARKYYGPHYRGGVYFNNRYDNDPYLHITPEIKRGSAVQPADLIPGAERGGGEATFDQMPSEAMLRKIDEQIARGQGKDFAFYYLSDEPECRSVSPVYLKYLYEYIADKDPYHAVMIAIRGAAAYIDCADWFQVHPYICPYDAADGSRTYVRPINTMGGWIDEVVNMNRPDKCIGFLPTCYCHHGTRRYGVGYDYPNFDETVAHTWAAMIHGGKTLWPYAYHDINDTPRMYEGFRYVFASFEALEDIVLLGKRTTLTRSAEAEAVLYEYGNEKMFVLINFTQQPQTVTLDGIDGTWHSFCHNETLTGNTFDLKPLETIVATNTVKDAGLPTYQETEELINKLEYERTHRENLIYEADSCINVTIPKKNRFYTKKKLFDGTRDNLAVELFGEDVFIELDLSKEDPTFSKINIFGYQVDKVTAYAVNGEERTELTVLDQKNEEFATYLTLDQKVNCQALRLEFDSDLVELYEIELA